MLRGRSPASLIVFILSLNVCTNAVVWELDKSNFNKFRKTASFPIFFLDSLGCSRCRVLYPFFYAASQVFVDDREIFFGRVQDKSLIRDWGIEELPVILYYEKGEQEAEALEGDITVDNIVSTISRAMPGYIGSVTLQHVIEVTDMNYDELVVTPKQNALVLIYDNEVKSLRDSYEKVASAFRYDEQILFCALDADKYPQLKKDRFGHQHVPAMYWYEAHDKLNKYIYGSMMHPEAWLTFVNGKTNLQRKKSGELEPESGRIANLDDVFDKFVVEIKALRKDYINAAIAEMKSAPSGQAWEVDFAEYYVELLERVAESESAIVLLQKQHEEFSTILNEDEGLTQKQRDFIQRRRNIVQYMMTSLKEVEGVTVGEVAEDKKPEPTERIIGREEL